MQAALDAKLNQLSAMQEEMAQMKQQMAVAEDMRLQVQQLADDGFIKQGETGRLEPVLDPNESEYIRSNTAQATKRTKVTPAAMQALNQQLDDLNE